MGKLEDFIRELPTDIQLPPGFLSAIQDAHGFDIAEKDNEIGIRDAKINDTTTSVESLTRELDAQKLKNYDLLMGTAITDPDSTKNPQSESNDEDNKTGVDSLFE